MPTAETAKRATRHEIPSRLLDAKRAAATQFLVSGEPEMASAYAVSTRPHHNVVGIGIGRKITKGKMTGERCVRFYVERKLDKTAIAAEFMLPRTLNGVPTDVIETGRFRAQLAAPAGQKKMRPGRPGCSVGFQFTGAKAGYVMAGTFGAVVAAGGVTHILSNNHVLADENALPIGSPIFQPGLLDHGNAATDQIAKLTRFVTLKADAGNAVDCAIAETLARNVSATVLPRVGRMKSAEPIDAVEGMKVHKSGRTTGYTTGSVFDVSATVKVQYDLGTLTFDDQILIRGDRGAFSAAGDSGSLIVDRGTGRATGLLFGGGPQYTIANHFSDVLTALGATLVV